MRGVFSRGGGGEGGGGLVENRTRRTRYEGHTNGVFLFFLRLLYLISRRIAYGADYTSMYLAQPSTVPNSPRAIHALTSLRLIGEHIVDCFRANSNPEPDLLGTFVELLCEDETNGLLFLYNVFLIL